MKIAIVGTHGIGKTTLAYQIAAQAKMLGKNAVTLSEVARSCPFPLNDSFTIDGATWIVTSQVNRELSAKADKYDVIVCDRSAYDPICYLQAGEYSAREFQRLRMFAEEWLKTYDTIIYVYPVESILKDDGVRDLNKDFQMSVDVKFKKYINDSICANENFNTISSKEIFDGTAIKKLEIDFDV